MCTLVLLRRPGHDWPLILAANRDEMAGRPWQLPSRHWPDREDVVAGLDELAGGTWLGVNDRNMVAGILNRMGTLGPAENKRSRGELPLEALDHEDAKAAADALSHLNADAYRSFNLVVADATNAYWIAAREDTPSPQITPIPEGLSMITAYDLNDGEASPRIRHYQPLFESAPPPNPESGDWSDWERLLSSYDSPPGEGLEGAMCFTAENGFGTRSSSLIALPKPGFPPRPAIWRFCPGPPDATPWVDIDTSPPENPA